MSVDVAKQPEWSDVLAAFDAAGSPVDPLTGLAVCPVHRGDRHDLLVAVLDDGQPAVMCFSGCSTAAVLEAVGLPSPAPADVDAPAAGPAHVKVRRSRRRWRAAKVAAVAVAVAAAAGAGWRAWTGMVERVGRAERQVDAARASEADAVAAADDATAEFLDALARVAELETQVEELSAAADAAGADMSVCVDAARQWAEQSERLSAVLDAIADNDFDLAAALMDEVGLNERRAQARLVACEAASVTGG